MTLTFDPLTLNFCGRSNIILSLYVPNLSEVDYSTAEGCSNTAGVFEKMRVPICTKLGGDIVRSSLNTRFKNCSDILLGFQTTAGQSQALVSDKVKNRTF